MENLNINQNETNENPSLENEEKVEVVFKAQKPQKYKVESAMYTFLMIFAIAFLSFLFVFQIYMSPIKVVGSSMQPTINLSITSDSDDSHSDVVYYRKTEKYKNNDIVIIANKNQKYVNRQDVQYLIKRVVACPGQTITFYLTENNFNDSVFYYSFYVTDESGNRVEIDDSYLTEEMYFSTIQYYANITSPTYFQIFSQLKIGQTASITISENCYFVMGDNRNNSEDSRYFGEVSSDTISGKVKLHVPYGSSVWDAVWQKIKEIA